MSVANTYSGETEVYWNLIKNAADEVKLRLIARLSRSLVSSSNKSLTDKERTAEFISRYCGAWQGDDSAEDIIATIRSNRSCKDPISFDL